MLTRLRARLADDSGFTLVELVVAMIMASIVGSMALVGFLGTSTTSVATANSSFGTAAARSVLQEWSGWLQLAATRPASAATTSTCAPANGVGAVAPTGPIVALSPTCIDFYANLGNASCTSGGSCPALGSTEIVLSLTGGQLAETVNGATSYADLARGTASSSGCLFTPYVNSVAIGCSTPNTSQLATATGVGLAFTVTPQTGHPSSYSTSAAFTTGADTVAGASSYAPLS